MNHECGPRFSPEQEKNKENEAKEKVTVVFGSKEEALQAVKEFWAAMPHAQSLNVHDMENLETYAQELTAGDRTTVTRAVGRGMQGKFQVIFRGNHQPLSDEALNWLQKKGYNS